MANEVSNKISEVAQTIGNNLPVIVSLFYGIANYIQFPIAPEKIKKDIPSPSTTTKVENTGEVGVPTKPGLATITLNSFLWQDKEVMPVSLYINWLTKWQKSKKPAKLIVTRLNYSMYVTCENFSYETRAGEENDIYFNIELQEYRPYGARLVGVPKASSIFDTLSAISGMAPPILIPIPRPSRFANVKIIVNPYITKKNDTLVSISKKLKNSSEWKKLYNLNKSVVGNAMMDGDGKLPVGLKLKLPSDWLGVEGLSSIF